MALTPEEVKRMEEQANLSDRFNKASDRYVAGDNPGLRAMEREQVLRQREGDVFAQARQRTLDSKMMTAVRDPGRYSAFETKALQDRFNQQGLRQHELDMLRQEGKNKIGVAHETALGMRGQGVEAAQIRAKADKDIAWINSTSNENIAETNAFTTLETEQKRQENALKIEQEKGKNAMGVAKEQRRASDYASDAKVDAEREKGLQIAAQNVHEEQIAKWKMQHEKELEQMRLDGQIPDEREARGLIVLQDLPENKGKTISQILQEMRKAQRR